MDSVKMRWVDDKEEVWKRQRRSYLTLKLQGGRGGPLALPLTILAYASQIKTNVLLGMHVIKFLEIWCIVARRPKK